MAGRAGGDGAGGASSSAASSAHSIELLAPLYPDVYALLPTPSPSSSSSVHFPLTLLRAADDWLKLVFPSLGRGVEKHAACLNGEACACSYVHFLGDVMELEERGLLRVSAEYVVHRSPEPTATIQLDVTLHKDHDSRGDGIPLQEFEFVLCHLQMAVLNVVEWRERRINDADVDDAKQSACHVIGCRLHPNVAAAAADGDGNSTDRLQLTEVFRSLTSQTSVKQMEVRDDKTYESRMLHTQGQADTDTVRGVILTDLPTIALQNLVCMMNARDLAAISGVCSMFQHMAYEVVPGLNLVLYEHQRRGLKWMLRRESALASRHSAVPHPFMFPSITSSGRSSAADAKAKVIDLVDYKLVGMSRAVVQDTRGGLFCDEPGLGKTITVLALILRTQGQRSKLRHTLESRDNSGSFHGSGPSSGVALRSSRTRGRAVATSELVRSHASLIVVPDPLVEHWKYQIEMHVAPGALRVFIDVDDKSELPSNSKLARYDVVVTSFTRLTREWKYHRPASALEMRMPDRYGFEDSAQRYADGQARGEVSALLTVNWIRVIVDEGHKLGGKSTTNIMLMARLLSAERRWVMTGTPTPNTLQSADLQHMHGLLVFLRNLPYGNPDGKAWIKAIARPFEQNERIAFYRVQHLLSRIMLRHTKESIRSILPEPVRQVVLLDPTPNEYEEYNAVAASVRANLVTTNMDPDDPGSKHEDSLMNPINRSSALIVVRNLRASTCSGAQMRVLLTDKSLSETLTMLTHFNVDADLVRLATEYMRRVVIPGLKTRCECCQRMLQILMLIPCGHLCCADCVEDTVAKDGYVCFKCNKRYDPEDFQRLQPGLEYSRIEDDEDDEGRPNNRRRRGGRERQGRQQTAEQQQGQQGGGRRRNRNRNRRQDDRQQGEAGAPRGFIPIDYTRDFDVIHASKAFYAVARIRELRDEFARGNNAPPPLTVTSGNRSAMAYRQRPRYVKAIIFSQFKEHIWKIRIAFAQQGVQTANFISGLNPEARMRELVRFRNDPSVSVLLLTEIGSHGLDLSFVTHVFLMEEIWDKSLEQQVVSRAHRMGASQSVVVEQLVMRNTIETLMRTMNERGLDAIREEEEEKERQLLLTYFRAGLTSATATSPAHVPPAASARKPHTGSGSMFGKSSKKRKRQANGDASSHKDKDGKTSALQQRVHYVLSNLRLLEESVCAEPGRVRFMVLNNDHKIIRRGIHLMNGPTERAVTSSVEFSEASAATYQASAMRTATVAGAASRTATARSPAPPARSIPAATASPATPSACVLQRAGKAPQRRPSVPEVIVIDSSSSDADGAEDSDAEDSDAGGSVHDETMEAERSSSSSSSDDDDDMSIPNMLRKAHQLMEKRRKRVIASSDEEEKKEAEPQPPPQKQQRTEAPTTAPTVVHRSLRREVVMTEVTRIAGRSVTVVTIDSDEDDMSVVSESSSLPPQSTGTQEERNVSITSALLDDDDSGDDGNNEDEGGGDQDMDGGSDTASTVVQREQSGSVAKMVRFDASALEVKGEIVASVVTASAVGVEMEAPRVGARKTVRFSEVNTIHPIVAAAAATYADDEETGTESE